MSDHRVAIVFLFERAQQLLVVSGPGLHRYRRTPRDGRWRPVVEFKIKTLRVSLEDDAVWLDRSNGPAVEFLALACPIEVRRPAMLNERVSIASRHHNPNQGEHGRQSVAGRGGLQQWPAALGKKWPFGHDGVIRERRQTVLFRVDDGSGWLPLRNRHGCRRHRIGEETCLGGDDRAEADDEATEYERYAVPLAARADHDVPRIYAARSNRTRRLSWAGAPFRAAVG